MIFSFGNLITVIAVLLILVIYRQIDRNNRSLVKVKRFSDRITDNLNKIVDERTAEFKDLSIDLHVNLKTGKEILKKVREIEDWLNQKTENVEGIRKRLTDYDHVLEELVNMTNRVDENLKRVRAESLFVDKIGRKIKDSGQRLDRVEKQIVQVQKKFYQDGRNNLLRLKNEVSKDVEVRIQAVTKEVEGSEQKVKDFSSYISRLETRRADLENDAVNSLKKIFEGFELEAKARQTSLANQFVGSLNKLLSKADEKGKMFKKAIESSIAGAEQKLDEQQRILEETAIKGERLENKVFLNLKEMVSKDAVVVSNRCEALRNSLKEADVFHDELEKQVQNLKKETEHFKRDAIRKLDMAAEEIQTSIIQRIDKKLENYEGEVDYRFQKLEEANVDIESFEENLKALMEKTSLKVKEDFNTFTRSFNEERKVEKQQAEQEFGVLHGDLKELQDRLAELKSSAYQDVSEQLQVFEDEFFKDLKERNLNVEEKVRDWQSGIERRMLDISSNYITERDTIEKRYSEELKIELEKVRRTVFDELKRVDNQIADFEGNVNERITDSGRSISNFSSNLKQEMAQVRQDSQSAFQKELDALNDTLGGNLQRINKDAEERLRGIEGSLNLSKKEMQEVLDAARSDIAAWQTRILQQIKEAETGFSEKISGVRLETETILVSIRDDFSTQKDELITSTNEERIQLRNELKSISDRIIELESTLTRKSEDTVEKTRKELESFQIDFKRRTKDLQSDMISRVKVLKKHLGEMRLKSDARQQTSFGKIDEHYKLLKINFSDIDKRVKNFTVQTKLFERADELKITLEDRIEEMKRDIDKLQAQNKEIQEMESQLLNAKKVTDEISARLGKILSERRRIEDMESDFKKLLNVSRDLDHRIETVYSSQDTVQEIQAKIRELENLEKITENRYERLERKKIIIENTTAGVDKNFQYLDNLEKNLGTIKGEFENFTDKVEELRTQTELLSANKEKSDSVVNKIEDLDNILKNLETRIGKMETAREWLARTETRFENIGKQAQEQVKLLESILKAEGKESKPGQGAPPLDRREMVIKLAHQGWNPQEISRATKLSRGEVELILELGPKK